MRQIFLDFESYYSDDYSLRKMSIPEYLLDIRWQTIGLAVKEGLAGTAYWVDGPDVPKLLADIGKDVMTITHNALFDATVLAWKYQYVPRISVCTLSISRAVYGYRLRSLSLSSVAKFLNLGDKGDAIVKAKGMTLEMLKDVPLWYERFKDYGLNDVELCAGIFRKAVVEGEFPIEELAVIDMTIRAATQPVFRLDRTLLHQHLRDVVARKDYLMSKVTYGAEARSILMSNEKFAEVLRAMGVIPPMKISLTTGKSTYAFAKTDVPFLDLLEHENPDVQALVAARLGVKSTIEETRTQRFIAIGNLTPEGLMPVPLGYGRAHTHRLGGEWKINMQNLGRTSPLRKALMAPPGCVVLTVDASQIEARLAAWLAKCLKLLTQFTNKEDVYSLFAAIVFGYPIIKGVHTKERYIGKSSVLGLNFGMGWLKFQTSIKTKSETDLGQRISLSDEESLRIVNVYRSEFPEIPQFWRVLDQAIYTLDGTGLPVQLGPVLIVQGRAILPSLAGEIGAGLSLYYHGLKSTDAGWQFEFGGQPKRLHGPKFLENLCQALDRVIVFGAALRLRRRLEPYALALQAHDENVFIVRQEHKEVAKAIMLEEMTRRPPWAPDLPLAAEVHEGTTYGNVK